VLTRQRITVIACASAVSGSAPVDTSALTGSSYQLESLSSTRRPRAPPEFTSIRWVFEST